MPAAPVMVGGGWPREGVGGGGGEMRSCRESTLEETTSMEACPDLTNCSIQELSSLRSDEVE